MSESQKSPKKDREGNTPAESLPTEAEAMFSETLESDSSVPSLAASSTLKVADPLCFKSIDKVDNGQIKPNSNDEVNSSSCETPTNNNGIKKRSSGSQKRNYRQAYGLENSFSSDDEPCCSKSTESKQNSENQEKVIQEDVSKSSKDDVSMDSLSQSGDKIENTEPNVASSSSNKVDANSPTVPVLSSLKGSQDCRSPVPIPASTLSDGSDYMEATDTDSVDSFMVEPRSYGIYPTGIDTEDEFDVDNISISSSSSTSLQLMDEDELEEDDTSESSDSDLEDLEERSPVLPTKEGIDTATKKKKTELKKKQNVPKVLLKPKPKSTWSGPREIFNREIGYRGKSQCQSAEIFRSKFYGSLFSVERLELMKKLDGHTGCVNCLHFNYSGTKLVSGSDDLHIKIWNFALGKLLASFNSAHRSNVFQAKFLPLVGIDDMIVSCARDCQVLLTELDSTGSVASSRKLAQHRGAVHKLTVNPETPHVILTCGEDAIVYNIDIREEKPQKLLSLREKGKKVALYSIHGNPLKSAEFCVTGRDEYIRIFDIRKLSTSTSRVPRNSEQEVPDSIASDSDETSHVKRFCPHHLQESSAKPHVTAAVYNYNGNEIIGSYNDENIYLFDATHSDLDDFIKVYEGHRNSATVKGVNFFGEKSQYVVSGSDCGHIFIWDKQTESIVNFFRGDENGVVNTLEFHPSAPILATSGLDDDVKIWIPSSENAPKMGDLAPTVKKNIRRRTEELDRQPDALDGHIMWALWSHLQRGRNRRNTGGDTDSNSDSDFPPDETEDEDDPRGVECSIS